MRRRESSCGRPSGRSRIGTKRRFTHPFSCHGCGRPSGRSRIGTAPAIALSQRPSAGCGRPSGRSRIGTRSASKSWRFVRAKLRSSFGAIEDWNWIFCQNVFQSLGVAVVLRGDRGLEPKNVLSCTLWVSAVAVVLRGDRGLELPAS